MNLHDKLIEKSLSRDSIKGMRENDLKTIIESMFDVIEDLEKRLAKLEKP